MSVKLKKKPLEVEGVQFTGDNHDEITSFCGEHCHLHDSDYHPVIKTLEGEMHVSRGDWVVKGAKGEFYPVKPEVFAETYDNPEAAATPAMEKHWNKEEREAASSSDWALPKKKKLRISDAKHTRLAWQMVHRVKGITPEEVASAKRRILAKARKFGMDTSEWGEHGVSKEDIDSTFIGMETEESGSAELYPPPINVFSHLIVHCMEEASEIVWAFAKAQRYGLESICPEAGITNREKIVKEMAEFRACLTILDEELEGAGQPAIQGDDASFQEAFQKRMETLQLELNLGRFTLDAAD